MLSFFPMTITRIIRYKYRLLFFNYQTVLLWFFFFFFYFTSNSSWHQYSSISWLWITRSLRTLRNLGRCHFDVVGQRSSTNSQETKCSPKDQREEIRWLLVHSGYWEQGVSTETTKSPMITQTGWWLELAECSFHI